MEYHGKFGHKLGSIQHIALMSRIDLCCETCLLVTQTVSPNLPGFQGIKLCVQYLASHPHQPIFYPYNFMLNQMSSGLHGVEIKLKTTKPQFVLEFHQDAYHAIILNRRWSVMVIIHTLLGVAVC